jgi:hypothetical protein
LTDFKKPKKLEASELVLLRSNTRIRQPDNLYKGSQIRNFVSMFPASLEHLTIKHCDNAIVEPVLEFLGGELPPGLKAITLEFRVDAAIKAQFTEGRVLVEGAFGKGG